MSKIHVFHREKSLAFPSSQRRGGCAERSEGADGVVRTARRLGGASIEASPYRACASRHPDASGSVPFLLRRFRFSDTGAAKNGRDHRIAFVAGPLVDWPF